MSLNKLVRSGLVAIMLALSASASAEDLLVAAASDLSFVLPEINKAFEAKHPGVTVKVSLGSSGNFHAQIQNGAPYQVFMSADEKYPRDLIAAGNAVADTYNVYGTGRIVLWTMKPELNLSQGLSGLVDAKVTKIAIANPAHAPYGRAAEAAMKKQGVWDALQSKLVLGENISQTAQFVQTGNVDVGVVAMSLVLSPKMQGMGRWAEISTALYPALVQAVVVTKVGENSATARAFVKFLDTPVARELLQKYGFRDTK
ncbi:MAG: molybdate ABC transporter substrate-binding protein [Sulfuriferula sp.]|nr:molybdate ABC transporter substrate-binding protein [Sulfuriferula sp.]